MPTRDVAAIAASLKTIRRTVEETTGDDDNGQLHERPAKRVGGAR